MNILERFNNFLNKLLKNEEKEEDICPVYQKHLIQQDLDDPISVPTHDIMSKINFDILPEVVIENDDKNKPSLLLLDDISATEIIYSSAFNNIRSEYGVDIVKDFKIIKCLKNEAGYMAYYYNNILNNKIDYALLDLTLEHRLIVEEKDDDGKINKYYICIDGVDVAKYLLDVNPDVKFMLSTAHTKSNNDIVNKYREKLLKHTGVVFDNVYLNKSSDLVEKTYALLYSKNKERTV